MSVPPPAEGPQPPAPDDRHDTAELPVTVGSMRRAFRINEILTVLVAVATAVGALLGGYRLFVSDARAAGREEAAEARHEVAEMKLDLRALYNAVLTGQRQPRLELPAPLKDAP